MGVEDVDVGSFVGAEDGAGLLNVGSTECEGDERGVVEDEEPVVVVDVRQPLLQANVVYENVASD